MLPELTPPPAPHRPASLAAQPFVTDLRFTIACITAFRARADELPAPAHLQAWRDRIGERPSAAAQ
jgi:glutathione S-transferase